MNRNIGYKLLWLIVIFMVFTGSCYSSYEISNVGRPFALETVGNYYKVICQNSYYSGATGFPELPLVVKRYYIPSDKSVIGLRIITARKEIVRTNIAILPSQRIIDSGSINPVTHPFRV